MDIFKQRLKELGVMIIVCIVLIILAFIPFGLILLTGYIYEQLPGIIVSVIVFGLIGFWVLKGIHWLFIEPFKKSKEEPPE